MRVIELGEYGLALSGILHLSDASMCFFVLIPYGARQISFTLFIFVSKRVSCL